MKHWIINRGVKATPASTAIDLHYENNRFRDRWSYQRFDSLCGMMRVSHVELASLIGMTHDRFSKHPIFTQPECILLTLLESFLLTGMKVDAVQGDILPMKIIAERNAQTDREENKND